MLNHSDSLKVWQRTVPMSQMMEASRLAGLCGALCRAMCGAAVIAAAAQCSVAIGPNPVPLSLQSQAVLVVAATLGTRQGILAVLMYLLAGAQGLPVFALAHGGLHHLLGLRGGYLLSYVPVALWVGWAQSQSLWVRLVAFGGSAVLTLVLGTVGLSLWLGPKMAMQVGFWPFVGVDACKAVAAFLLVTASRSALRRRGPPYAV